MKCPFCGFPDDKVVDSRPSKDNESIRRRRECLSCARRFTTYEQIEDVQYSVVKKDGRREMFDRRKIHNGLVKATEKRPITSTKVLEIVDEIERVLHTKADREMSTQEIGEFIMKRLADLDEISYVRFASVYRQFKDVDQFYAELKNILIKDNTQDVRS